MDKRSSADLIRRATRREMRGEPINRPSVAEIKD